MSGVAVSDEHPPQTEPEPQPPQPRRSLSAVIEYDGTGFSGWQRQGEQRTVQRTIEDALSAMCDETIRLRAASRTDAGVHARGQVIKFTTSRHKIPLYGFERGLNARLPRDIAVRTMAEVDWDWDPRGAARGKHYRYTLWHDPLPTALDRARSWWVRGALDTDAMQRAADQMVGTHDFEAFRSAGCASPHAVRTMYEVKVTRGPRSFVYLDVLGNAFCRNQVRIMVGTLREVGGGRRAVESVGKALASRVRADAGITAPPEGLCLEEVIFDARLPPKPQATHTLAEARAGAELDDVE